MKSRAAAILGLLLVWSPGPVFADVVTEWNKTAIDVMHAANVVGNPWSRALAMVFGPRPAIPFTTSDLVDPKVTRSFTSIAQLSDEHMNVRVWGGIHFRNSLEVGYEMGRKLAVYLVESSLKPTR